MCKQLICRIIFIPVLGLIMTNTVYAQDPSLVGWWKFDEGTGSTIIDSSSYGNDSNITSIPLRWVDGRINSALQFDGIGDYVELIDGPSLDITDVITITMWVNTNSAANGVPNALVMKGEFTYGMRIDDANNLEFYIYSGGYHRAEAPLTDSFNGIWHHLAGIYDGNALSLYIDGELEATVEHSGAINKNDDYFVNFGRNSQGGTADRWWYEGLMDDVRIYNRVLSLEEIRKMLLPELPSMPIPADGAGGIWDDVILGWTPGISAQKHDVYLGTIFDEINEASRGNPMNVLVSRNQSDNTYDPAGSLEFDQTYYWRVDEVEADSATIHTGKVWSFTVPFGFPIEQVTATASSSEEGKEPENTVNGSGLDSSGLLHGKRGKENMWLSSRDGQQPTWIEFEFDKVYKLHEMWVWNSNESLERMIGLGFKEVTVEYSLDGTEYTTLGITHEFAQAPGEDDYAHNTTIEFNGEAAKYVKLTAHSNWGGILNQYGLSEVRFLHVPVHATQPTPSPGTAEVALDAILSWKAGREAVEHIVYLSDDVQAVIDGTAVVVTVTDTSYGPLSLDLGKTYYWRIDEVNNAEALNIWQGDIWDFTTHEYFVVDDFEDYNDYPPDEIFSTWIDGYGVETNGSTIGYDEPDFPAGEHFVETTIVHSGEQSMPYFYDNTTAGNSEATRTLDFLADWTRNGIGTLTLWYIGDAANAVEQMYVILNDSAFVNNDNPNAAQITEWVEWNIDLQEFADQGIDLTNVSTIGIGFGDRNSPQQPEGSGLVYIDDIRLYPPPESEHAP